MWIKFTYFHFSSLIPKMSIFILATSYLTASSLPWFTDLTFQVPTQCCFWQHHTFLSPANTSTTEHCSHFGPFSSFFMELLAIALCFSPVAYWTTLTGGRGRGGAYLPVSYLFAFSNCSWDFQGKNTRRGAHFLLQWTTFCQNFLLWLFHLGWPCEGLAHSFTELCKPLCYDKTVIHEGVCLLFFLNKHLLLEWFYIFRRVTKMVQRVHTQLPLQGKPHITIIHLSKLREKLIIN